jgi:O-antigen/teichoic acid export membrane protein
MQKPVNQKELDRYFKLLVKSSLFVFFGVFLSKIFSYIYRVIIARYFGPEIYGSFSLAVIIFLWFVVFSSLGLFEGLLRFIPFYKGKKRINNIRHVFKFSLIILFFSSILAGLILFFSAEFISINIFNDAKLIFFLKIFSLLIPLYIISYALLTVIQSFERIAAQSFIVDFLQNFLKVIFLILLIFIGLNIDAIIFSYFLGVLGVFLASFIYCKYKLSEIFKKIRLSKSSKRKIQKELFSYSWPLILLGILSEIMPNIDSFIIGYFNGTFDVGIYNAAIPIAWLIVFFPSLFLRLFSPLINREFSRKNIGLVSELSKQIVKWILIVNLPFFLLMILFPGVFINILFGQEYLGAENSLRFLATAYLFSSITMISHNLISMTGRSKIILTNIVIISFLNLILNIFLVPIYGISGAAFATMVSQIILTFIFFFQTRYYVSIVPLRRKMTRIFISIIPPTVLLIYLKQFITANLLTLFFQGSLFILFYLFLIFITRSLDEKDIMILDTIKKKIFD